MDKHRVVSSEEWLAARQELVPKGRDEAGLPYNQAWVRHHDNYGSADNDPRQAAARRW